MKLFLRLKALSRFRVVIGESKVYGDLGFVHL